ncbi:MAG: hypothetical protein EOP42_12305 [Sphingobacteriaceae bacterium]|nr:MAG: hypothetical protein EOP42_12305 [Sphingobacteriaceae bacterium]
MSKHQLIKFGLIISLLVACKGKKNDPVPVPPIPAPAKAILLLPAQNEVCASGENQTSAQSTILFDWSDAANTDSYILSLKNLLTGVVTEQTSTVSNLKITVPRGTPFSWTVTSKSAKSTTATVSDLWKFYNSGVGQLSYAPFPATLTAPTMSQIINYTSASITLTWVGSDADNDIATYDVYFGKTDTPILVATNKADVQSLSVAVATNTIYYWKVITKDVKGNTSDSGVNQFKIN